MADRTSPNPTVFFVAAAVALAVGVFLATQFPAVEGLGAKVRLPVFHGAFTWANLSAFSLMAQFWTLLLALLLLLLPLFVDGLRALAIGDIAFTAVMWTLLLRAILGPGRALHPDSPVLNSPEMKIKLLFFGMFLSLLLAALLAAWGVSLFAKTPAADQRTG